MATIMATVQVTATVVATVMTTVSARDFQKEKNGLRLAQRDGRSPVPPLPVWLAAVG
jgi:hypothetical protein